MPERLLTFKGVGEKIGFKETKIRRLIQEEQFPPGRIIHNKRVWLESDVDAWIKEQWAAAEPA